MDHYELITCEQMESSATMGTIKEAERRCLGKEMENQISWGRENSSSLASVVCYGSESVEGHNGQSSLMTLNISEGAKIQGLEGSLEVVTCMCTEVLGIQKTRV